MIGHLRLIDSQAKRRNQKPFILFPMLIVSMGLCLCACQDNATVTFTPTQTNATTNIAFEVIAQDDWDNDGTSYEKLEPAIIAIRDRSEGELVRDWIQADFMTQLENLDYDPEFALALFQGEKSTSGYSLDVMNIAVADNTIDVYANFVEPKSGSDKEDSITSPYVLVLVTEGVDWKEIDTVNLVVKGDILAVYSVR